MFSPDRIRRRWIPAVLGLSLAILVGAFAVLYFAIFPSSSPKKLALSAPKPTAQPGPGVNSPTAGRWSVVPQSSTVGYRVREKLASLPAPSDAVGRTSAVTGSLDLQHVGTQFVAKGAHFGADLTTLKSDQGRRDSAIKTRGLEATKFPQATFTVTEDIAVLDTAQRGQPVQVPVKGDLAIHGVSRPVTIPLTAQFRAGQIEVVGSLTFPFSDFAMTPPSIGSFVTVTGDATLEFRLVLAHG